MNNDDEAQEIHGTVVSSGRFPDPAADDRTEASDVTDRDLDPEDEVEDVEDDEDREDDVAYPADRAAVDGQADDEVLEPDAVIIDETDAVIIAEGDDEPADDEAPEPVAGFARTPVAPPEGLAAGGVPGTDASTPDAEADADAERDAAGIGQGTATTTGGAAPAAAGTVPGADAVPEADVIAEAARPGVPRHAGVPVTGGLADDPEQLHQRWSAIQAAFVDDPRASVADAAEFVSEAIAALVASIQEREHALRGEWEDDGADTENLRNTLRGYRDLLDQLIGGQPDPAR